MKINNLPRNSKGGRQLNPLVFITINDSPDNPRFGLGHRQLYDPQAEVALIAKLPDVTRVGDTIILYWDDVNVQQYSLDQRIIDDGWLSFGVSPLVIRDPQGEVYYTLYDHNADHLQTSPKRIIAVNRLVPGGLDPDTGTAINEGLQPCTVSPNPVTQPASPVTVSVLQWEHQEIGDELTVMWNNIPVLHPKLQTLGPQTVSIPREVLEAGGSSDKLLVNYEIRDIVDNYSLVSPPTYVTVEIDPDALLAPRVVEADRTTLILDLAALGDNDAHVVVPSHGGNGNAYLVTLSWVGKTPAADISLNLPPQRVEDPAFDRAEFSIPNAHMKAIAGGSAVVRYKLLQDGDPVEKQSKTTTITITGLPVELAKPVVTEANGSDIIDLVDVTGADVTVSIAAYTGQAAGDKVLLTWKGTSAQGIPVNYTDDYDIQPGEEQQPVTFTVARLNLDPLVDGTLELSYQVIFRASAITQTSPIMHYTVRDSVLAPVSGDESFELQNLYTLPLGVAVPFANNLRITVTASRVETAVVTPGINEFGDKALYCAANNTLKFDFTGSIDMLMFSHALTATAQNRLDFFDRDGTQVSSFSLPVIPAGQRVGFETIRLPSRCAYCELTVGSTGILLDNLIWF